MKKLFAILILIAMVLTLFAGCQKPRDPNVLYEDALSEETKQEIYHEFLIQCDTWINWDYFNPFYGEAYLGTINDCMIVHTSMGDPIPEHMGLFEVAGYTFKWSSPFNFHVYRDGEACALKEAYEKGWLTKEQIEKIYKKHNTYYENFLRGGGNEDDLSVYHPDYFCRANFSKEMEQKIASELLRQCSVTVNLDAAHTFLGGINSCVVLMAENPAAASSNYVQKIAGYDFEQSELFGLYVYRDGEACTLKEAYEKGWLTQLQIGKIHNRYSEHYANSSDPNLLYKKTLTEEEKDAIHSKIRSRYSKTVRWGYVDPYYGTINNCSVVIAHPFGTPKEEAWEQEIAGYTFGWDSPIVLFVYYYEPNTPREVCTLKEAYNKGLLTEKQIGIIHEKHVQYRENFPELLEQWQKDQEKTQGE